MRLGKRPVVGHAHGSDLRTSLKHPAWGRIVRYNLKNSDKVLVSTPDVLGQAKAFREDAEYLPNPVDTEFFCPKPLVTHDGKKRVLIASDSNWSVKKTDLAIKALSRIKGDIDVSIIAYGADFDKTVALARMVGLRLNVLPKVPHAKMNKYYWDSDVVIDRFTLGSLGVVSLEAIACGRPVVAFVSSEYAEYKDFPLKDVDAEGSISDAVINATYKLWERQFDYLQKNHSSSIIIPKILNIYKQSIDGLS
jgi:glycosyltransferase involved in cell wall biosynthesis